MTRSRILVAGVGNIFLGDDAFGVEVVRRLAQRPLPEGVRVIDFGIRGFDLAHALLDGYDAVILVDATCRGGPPGTLYVIEPDLDSTNADDAMEPHGLDPATVFRLVRQWGGRLDWLRLVGCEPAVLDREDGEMGLSEPVCAVADEAVRLVEALIADFVRGASLEGNTSP